MYDRRHAVEGIPNELAIGDRADSVGERRSHDVHSSRPMPVLGEHSHQRFAKMAGTPRDQHDVAPACSAPVIHEIERVYIGAYP
jgi:hypothetical protein